MSVGVIATLAAGAYMLTRNGGDDAVEPTNEGFARLAARPLDLPRHLASGGGCELAVDAVKLPGIPGEGALAPVSAGQSAAVPKGPIYASLGGIPRTMDVLDPPSGGAWGIAGVALWVSDPSYRGPAVIRGGQLDGDGRIRFGRGRHPELELRLGAMGWEEDEGLRQHGQPVRPPKGWRVVTAMTRIRTTGCYAFQVDGEGFSYSLPFFATYLSDT